MRFRKLRIAFSAVCLTACALLIALWVRSFPWDDQLQFPLRSTHGVVLNSLHGGVLISILWKDNVNIVRRCATEHHKMRRNQVLGSTIDGPFQLLINDGGTLAILVPHWLFVLFGTFLAAIPCVPWPNRFSLRTLLITTTLIALALGTTIYFSQLAPPAPRFDQGFGR
jgi:hypothetical protein